MQQLRTKGTVYLAVAFTALGFLLIFLGWDGAAEKDFVAGQIPYVISGGLTGLGLVFAGIAMALVEAQRRDTARILAKLDQLIEQGGGAPEGEAATEELEVASSRPRRASRAPE